MSIARKVTLTAFGHRLTSRPMEWPEDKIGQDILLPLDMEKPTYQKVSEGSSINEYMQVPVLGRFEYSGGAKLDDLSALYVLVEVKS